jgi:hypothetical protein
MSKHAIYMILGICISLSISACAKVQASNNPSAERVFTTEPGYVCFLIRDDEGKGVGGSCHKE